MTYKIYNVDYVLNEENNKDIQCFEWFIPLFASESWENGTFKIFNIVKNKHTSALDLGAWIGATTIWLSKNFKHVIAIEADPIACEALVKNLKFSDCDNVEVVNKPIHCENSNVVFGVNQYVKTLADEGLGSSTSQIKKAATDLTDVTTSTITLSDIQKTHDFSNISFVKVDIEGGEENIFEDLFMLANKFKWHILLSFHLDWWNNKELDRFSKLFTSFNSIIVHNDNLQNIDNGDIIEYIKQNPFCTVYFS